MAKVYYIGEPENESEACAVKFLANSLPPDTTRIIHNFELCRNKGEHPYEYDIVVLSQYAVFHVEVKHFTGIINGNSYRWRFESGYTCPSPIPLANKKSRILASKLHKANLRNVYVETAILITDSRASIRIKDDQVSRVVTIGSTSAVERLTRLPKSAHGNNITALHEKIVEAIIGTNPKPSSKIKEIGLYNVESKIAQYDGSHTVYLASHKHIHTRPKTILKVFHLDLYTNNEEREKKMKEIFHDQEALRLIGSHPNIIQTGDFFAHGSNQFVLPHEYFERGSTLEEILKNNTEALTWQDNRYIIESVANGLKHCHKAGIIHSDVKPHNIVVVPHGDGCNDHLFEDEGKVLVKLVNFDLARISGFNSNSISIDAKEKLDPTCTAPEVWNDYLCASETSDVFSLGLTFYELITNGHHMPFYHVEQAIQSNIVSLDISSLTSEFGFPKRRKCYGKPKNIVKTIQEMTHLDHKQRLQNMDQVINELNLNRGEETGGLHKSEQTASMLNLRKICDDS